MGFLAPRMGAQRCRGRCPCSMMSPNEHHHASLKYLNQTDLSERHESLITNARDITRGGRRSFCVERDQLLEDVTTVSADAIVAYRCCRAMMRTGGGEGGGFLIRIIKECFMVERWAANSSWCRHCVLSGSLLMLPSFSREATCSAD